MKRKIIQTQKAQPAENKLKIQGVGTFVPEQMQGLKKAQLKELHPELTDEQHEVLWKAVSRGEMPEQQENEAG